MAAYPVILLAGGDIDFKPSLADQLLVALQAPEAPRLLLQQYHVDSLEALGKFAVLNATGRVEVLELWVNPGTKKGTAISNQRLAALSAELMPFNVSANASVQYQVNQAGEDWLIEVMNNDGVTKAMNAVEVIDYTKTSLVTVTAKFAYQKVLLWGDSDDKQISGSGTNGTSTQIVLPPGGIAHLRFQRT